MSIGEKVKLNWTIHEQCFEDLKPVNVYQMCCRENKTLLSQWTLDRGQWSLSETLIYLNVSLYSDSIWKFNSNFYTIWYFARTEGY